MRLVDSRTGIEVLERHKCLGMLATVTRGALAAPQTGARTSDPPTDGADAVSAVPAHDLLNDLAVISHLGAVLAGHGHVLDDEERHLLDYTRNDRMSAARGRLGGLPHRLARRAAWELDHLGGEPAAGHACAEMLTDVARGLELPLRVLLMESDPYVSAEVGDLLEQRGHEVVRCYESGDRAPRCLAGNGFADCPLDQPVDVAVTVRSPARPRPRLRETGVACAIHAGVPLVVAGTASENPYGASATIVTDQRHVIDACISAVGNSSRGWESWAVPGSARVLPPRPHDDGVVRELLVLIATLLALGLLVSAATLLPWLVVLVGPPIFLTRSLIRRAHEGPR